MRALTLWPEWAWCIVHLGKDVENRGWMMPRSLVGEWVALHAGKHVGGRPGRWAAEYGYLALDTMARRAGWTRKGGVYVRGEEQVIPPTITTSAFVALLRFGPSIQDSPSGWAVPDSWHWPILEMRPLPEPIPCRGAQGFWTVPFDVEVPHGRP